MKDKLWYIVAALFILCVSGLTLLLLDMPNGWIIVAAALIIILFYQQKITHRHE